MFGPQTFIQLFSPRSIELCAKFSIDFSSLPVWPLLHTASAVPVAGSGSGYDRTAWFTNNSGIVVGPYSTWAECNYQFQYTLNMRIQDWGWIATEIQSLQLPAALRINSNQARTRACGRYQQLT